VQWSDLAVILEWLHFFRMVDRFPREAPVVADSGTRMPRLTRTFRDRTSAASSIVFGLRWCYVPQGGRSINTFCSIPRHRHSAHIIQAAGQASKGIPRHRCLSLKSRAAGLRVFWSYMEFAPFPMFWSLLWGGLVGSRMPSGLIQRATAVPFFTIPLVSPLFLVCAPLTLKGGRVGD
jgi:hypothetical protein